MEKTFSIEMKSKEYVKHISIADDSPNRVLFEGTLGKMIKISIIEGKVLEFKGSNGVLRIDLNEHELQRNLSNNGGDK